MKAILISFLLLVIASGALAVVEVKLDQLRLVGGIRISTESGEPFSGMAVDYYTNGQKRLQIDFRRGIKQGKEVAWYKDGQLKHIVRYHRGEPQALGSSWYTKQSNKKMPQGFLRCDEIQTIESDCSGGFARSGNTIPADTEACERYEKLLEVCNLLTEEVKPPKNSRLIFCDGQADMEAVCGVEKDETSSLLGGKFIFCDDSPELAEVCEK